MVRELVSMGFPEQRSKKVLKLLKNNIDSATEHLCSYTEDMDDQILGV